jgi:hypothetical protein
MAGSEFAQGLGPFLREALGAYGDDVLTGEEVAPASPVADVGRRVLRATYDRGDALGRELLEDAVREAEQGADAAEVLTPPLQRALRKDPGLESELAALLPKGGTTVIASGERSVAAGGNIGIAITGDGHGRA